jgi:hypothetical protein
MRSLAISGLCLALLLGSPAQAGAAGAASRRPLAYHWPVKPFDHQHPVRGAFGDPRTVGEDQPFGRTGPRERGAHSFHNGIDIVASPGTGVFPVVSGRVTRATSGQVVVQTNDGRSFQYYHLSKAKEVRQGKYVVAFRTVLGWIRVRYGHVHLAEIDQHVIHNPLDPGRLEPYRDRTKPVATGLYSDRGRPLPSPLEGRPVGPGDLLSVAAVDPQAMGVPGPWFGLPQVPALVEWRLFHGQSHTSWKVVADYRHTQPPPWDFWDVYGPGTYQNSPTFADHIFLGTPGLYLFRLDLHPNRLSPGLRKLQVRVADIRGNGSTASWPLQIAS